MNPLDIAGGPDEEESLRVAAASGQAMRLLLGGRLALSDVELVDWDCPEPVLTLLVESLRPSTFVQIGAAARPFTSVCEAIDRMGMASRCIAVASDDIEPRGSAARLAAECLARWPGRTEVIGPEEAWGSLSEPVDLLYADLDDALVRNGYVVSHWAPRLRPGAVVVLRSAERVELPVWDGPSAMVSFVALGESSLILGQVNLDGDAPLLTDLMTNRVTYRQLAVLEERAEYRHVLGTAPTSVSGLSRHLRQLDEQRQRALDASRHGLEELRREANALSVERDALRQELAEARAQFSEQLSEERERTLLDSQAEAELLAAKLAVTVAQFERKLDELRQSEAVRRSELEAQVRSGIDQLTALRTSRSWRLTSPVRLVGRWARRLLRR